MVPKPEIVTVNRGHSPLRSLPRSDAAWAIPALTEVVVAFLTDAAERQVRREFAPILRDDVLLRHDCGKLTPAINAVGHGTVPRIDRKPGARISARGRWPRFLVFGTGTGIVSPILPARSRP